MNAAAVTKKWAVREKVFQNWRKPRVVEEVGLDLRLVEERNAFSQSMMCIALLNACSGSSPISTRWEPNRFRVKE